jgi:uncharacterized membrane protein
VKQKNALERAWFHKPSGQSERRQRWLRNRDERDEKVRVKSKATPQPVQGQGMLANLDYLKDRLHRSFWLVPGTMTIAAIVVALGMLWLDATPLGAAISEWSAPYAVGADGARLVLSTIAGSMITVASLVFSMTLVALTLAASSIGARLLDSYIANRVNQVALGLFLATFVYSLIVLRAVTDDRSATFVPHLSVSLAMVLAILSFGWLIYFIHELAKSIQVDNVVARVARELRAALERLPDPGPDTGEQADLHREIRAGMPRWPVEAGGSGYIQALDADGLVALAREHDVLIEMRFRPGQFVIPTCELAWVAGRRETDPELAAKIRDHVILGPKRTATQDIEFSIKQLVEVAARALSPGVNDFYTAIACIDHLTAALAYALDRGLPSNLRHDEQGRLRLELRRLAFEDLADAAFDPIRQEASDNVAVSIRLLESLTMLAGGAPSAERDVLERHGRLISADALRETSNDQDRHDLETRFGALQRALHGESAGTEASDR